MTTLYLLCGLPGAGKTTLGRQLEQSENALRLSPDEWILPLLQDKTNEVERDRLRGPLESIQWDFAKRALLLGVNIVLEFGFWTRVERDAFRAEAEALGAQVKLIYLAATTDELWARLEKRNASLPAGSFPVRRADLEVWVGWFEVPTHEELN
jgi:predicted kinase